MILPNQPQQFNKQQRKKRINPMIKMMNRISSTAMLAVAFMLCATSAWAAAPVATEVWEADQFKTASSGTVAGRNNSYSITYDTSNDTVDATNGKITIGGTKGLMISGISSASAASVLIKYSGVSDTCTADRSVGSISVGSNYPGLESSSASRALRAYYGANTASIANSPVLPSGSGYILLSYSYNNYFRAYVGSSLDDLTGGVASGVRWQNQTISSVSIGGPNASDSNNTAWNGLVIEKVALFVGNDYTGNDLAAYTFPSDDPTADYDYAATISADTTLSDITTWTKGTGTPGTSSKVYIAIENDAALTISGTLSLAQLKVVGGSIILANGASINSTEVLGAPIAVSSDTSVTINNSTVRSAISVTGGTVNIEGGTVAGAITASNSSTLNFTDCAINGGVDAVQNGQVTINTYGTVSFSGSASNYFRYSTTFNVESGTTTYNSSGEKQLWCTVNVKSGATLINEKHDAYNYGASSSYPINVHIYGTLTMNDNWTFGGGGNRLHLYDGALINGSAENALHFNSGVGYIIVETGVSVITASVVKGAGTINIETKAGTMLSMTSTPELASRSGNGLLLKRIVDNSRWGGDAVPENYDGVDLYSSGSHTSNDNEIFMNSSFNGYLKVTAEDGDYRSFGWVTAANFTSPVFSDRPTLELAGDMRIYQATAEKPFTVKNLSGTGDIYNYNDTDNKTFKYIDTQQTKDTTYSGIVKNISSCSECDPSLTVRGADDATDIYSLTLSGVSDTTAPLTIENNAKVVFSSTGKWSGGTVTVKDGGVLESQNGAAIAANLKVEEGATLKFADGIQLSATAYDWTSVSNDESVNVDLSAVTPSATPVTLIASGVTLDVGKFKVTAAQRTATLSLESGALKATFANYWRDGAWGGTVASGDDATLYISQNSMLSVSEALSLGAVTVIKEGEGNVTLTISGAGALTTGGWTIPEGVTVNTPTTMSISGTIRGDGVLNIPANATLSMDGANCSVTVTVEGTLETSGTTTLSGANTSVAGSLIHVVTGTTTGSFGSGAISGNLTIDTDAELSLTGLDGSYLWNTIPTSATVCIDVSGTLNVGKGTLLIYSGTTIKLRNGARILGNGQWPSNLNGALLWYHNAPLIAYGDAEISAIINTYSGTSPTFTVNDGATLTISEAFIPQSGEGGYSYNGGSLTKEGAGTLDLSAITPTKPITINAGTVVADEVPSANMTINANGTFTLQDCDWTSGNPFSGAGTLELKTTTAAKRVASASSTFAGIVKISSYNENNYYAVGGADSVAAGFTGEPELVIAPPVSGTAGFALGKCYDNASFSVRNFSGEGKIRGNYNNTANSTRTIATTQTRDTEFSGIFQYNNTTYTALTVSGEEATGVHSLTLSGASETTAPLTINQYGKVVFTGTGSWASGSVIVNDGGYLECTNNAAVRNLTLNDGATLVFPTSSSMLSSISSITFASGTVTNSFPGGVPANGGILINWAGASLDSAPAGSFVFDNGLPYKVFNGAYYYFQSDTTGLYILKAVAADNLTTPTFYMAVDAALAENDTVYLVGAPNETVTLTSGKTINNSLSVDVTRLTVNAPTAEYVSPIPAVNGSYSLSNAASQPATYYWTGAVDAEWWGTLGNWSVGATDGPTATRAMEPTDFVSFGDGANVRFASSKTVSGIAVSGGVTLSGGASLTVAGNITGTGSMTLNDVCLASSASGITVAPAVIFTNDSELAGANPLTLNGEVTITGVFKIWDSVHIISGAVTISSGATVQTGTTNGNGGALTITGPTRINGSFNKSGDNVLTLGAVTVASSAVPTITNGGSISLTGVVTIANGVTFTIPASNVSVGESASFVLAGRSAVLQDNTSGASGKVSTSLDDGARVVVVPGTPTIYKVGYGTIFSVY